MIGESIETQDGAVDRYLCGKPLSMANSRAIGMMENLMLEIQQKIEMSDSNPMGRFDNYHPFIII